MFKKKYYVSYIYEGIGKSVTRNIYNKCIFDGEKIDFEEEIIESRGKISGNGFLEIEFDSQINSEKLKNLRENLTESLPNNNNDIDSISYINIVFFARKK